MAANILVVEDETAIRDMLRMTLRRAGFEVSLANDAGEADACMAKRRPDLLVLDWMLPGMQGVDYVRQLRTGEFCQQVPVVMLTARRDESDRLAGFGAGVDDYVSKPFSPRELVARIKAVLRRTAPAPLAESRALKVRGLVLDPVSHRVTACDRPVHIGPTEFKLLHYLMAHPERVFTRAQLLDQVWGATVYIEERTVDVHIRRLRRFSGQVA